jgi:hypothetical protein
LKKLLLGGTSISYFSLSAMLLLCFFSQVPRLRSKSGKKKAVGRPQLQDTRPTPAQRIAAHIATQAPKPITGDSGGSVRGGNKELPNRRPISQTNQHGGYDEDDGSDEEWPEHSGAAPEGVSRIDDELGVGDTSSTEPESEEEEEHRKWED